MSRDKPNLGEKITNSLGENLKSIGKNTVKDTVRRANPFDKKINKSDVSDTGVEAVRLANQTVKNAKKAVKTTQKITKVSYQVAVAPFKIFRKTVQVSAQIVSNAVAVATSPITWALALLLVILIVGYGLLTVIMGASVGTVGGAAAAPGLKSSTKTVKEAYDEGRAFFETSIANKREEYNTMVSSPTYNASDIPHSDLVYEEKHIPTADDIIFAKSFATTTRIGTLVRAWEALGIPAEEVLGVVYVKLEKDAGGRVDAPKNVEFTQDAVDNAVNMLIELTLTNFANEECPDHNCTFVKETNPDYTTYLRRVSEVNTALDDYLEFKMSDPPTTDELKKQQDLLDSYSTLRDNLGRDYPTAPPETRFTSEPTCDSLHNLYDISYTVNTLEEVMDLYGFTDNDREWAQLTTWGFQSFYS